MLKAPGLFCKEVTGLTVEAVLVVAGLSAASMNWWALAIRLSSRRGPMVVLLASLLLAGLCH